MDLKNIKRVLKIIFPWVYRQSPQAWHMKRIKRGEPYIPKTIYIEATNFCNAACQMCPHEKMRRGQGCMSWELFKKIVDECKVFEGEGLQIFLHKDGEPLLDPLFFEKAKYIKANLCKSVVSFNSNAMLLDEGKSKELLGSGIDHVIFSVDGASREIYERIRVGLKHDIVKKNLDRFFELKKNSSSKIKATMQMAVCEDNKSEIEKYKEHWAKKADEVVFRSMHNFLDMGTSFKTKRLSKKQLFFCAQPFLLLMIYWNGDVGLCCWDYDNFCNIGNINNDSILNIYNNEYFKTIRTAMCKMRTKAIIPCNRCSQIYGQDMHMRYLAS